MVQRLVSRANGLELHIPADMGKGIRFFSVGEDARALIDDGQVNPNLTTASQLQSELDRTRAKLAALEAKSAETATKEVAKAPKKAKVAAVEAAPEDDTAPSSTEESLA